MRGLWFLLLAGLCVVLAELISRRIFRKASLKSNLHRGVAATLRLMQDGIWEKKAQFVNNPYGLYWNKPNSWIEANRMTCSRGYRWQGREIDPVKSGFRILVLGGSTTFSNHCFLDYKDTWCFKLEKILQEKFPDKHVEVINAGLNYGMTTELLSHYIFRGQYLNPDVVILHGPGNDVLPAAIGDVTNDYSSTRDYIYHSRRPYENTLLKKFGLLRCFYSFWLNTNNYANLEPEFFPSNAIQKKNISQNTGGAFLNNVRTLMNLCKSKGIRFVYVPFIYAPKSQVRKFHGELSEVIQEFEDKLSHLVDKEIAKTDLSSFKFLEIDAQKFVAEDFYDSCHLLPSGELKKAIEVSTPVTELIKTDL